MTERQLKPWAQELADDFYAIYGDGNCACHLSAPCGSCMHEGNPRNLEEDETAWGFDLDYETAQAIKRVQHHIERETSRHLSEMKAAHGIKEKNA